MAKDRELETEILRALNSVPLTRAAKRQIKKTLLTMEKTSAILLFSNLRSVANSLANVIETIRRSQKLKF